MLLCPHQYINEEQQTVKKGPQTVKKGPQAIKKDVIANVAKETA